MVEMQGMDGVGVVSVQGSESSTREINIAIHSCLFESASIAGSSWCQYEGSRVFERLS